MAKSIIGDVAYYAFHKFGDNGCLMKFVVCDFTHPTSSFYHTLCLREEDREGCEVVGRVPEQISRSSSGSHLKYESRKPSVCESSCLQHWFKNWQEKRKHKLTASTFAQAIGFFPRRRVQLWLEKIGAIKPFSGNMATAWSNVKEPTALEKYKLITGCSVTHPGFQMYGEKNPEYDWIGASPDGAIDGNVYGLSSGGVLEIKCPYFDGERQPVPWKRVPLYYFPQAQGLMEIMDRDWMNLYCWTTRGSSLFRIDRDPEYWYAVKVAVSDFWWKNVQPARDIYTNSVITEPLAELREFRPAPRHELCPYIVNESRIIRENSKLLMREIDDKMVG
ncbi:PREDICTED: uncharacterized protein LOC104799401 isoform X2 [Tarenaya hassleriana]|uniref:uncharacterized protein LOC104799401 isoform X2 n=1 Tax=Tarenaya hassleriana TaxID=28532 RepID=UPI00053C3266|nr:PREDICTED: uncharacterized protein LOC104799401 isoform X2 [Tarenaya hassleriana]XP_010520216.1 PREDICTED: uncharacterized protein LOC104799401 isoform X2 [Tarenaya hassleriana]